MKETTPNIFNLDMFQKLVDRVLTENNEEEVLTEFYECLFNHREELEDIKYQNYLMEKMGNKDSSKKYLIYIAFLLHVNPMQNTPIDDGYNLINVKSRPTDSTFIKDESAFSNDLKFFRLIYILPISFIDDLPLLWSDIPLRKCTYSSFLAKKIPQLEETNHELEHLSRAFHLESQGLSDQEISENRELDKHLFKLEHLKQDIIQQLAKQYELKQHSKYHLDYYIETDGAKGFTANRERKKLKEIEKQIQKLHLEQEKIQEQINHTKEQKKATKSNAEQKEKKLLPRDTDPIFKIILSIFQYPILNESIRKYGCARIYLTFACNVEEPEAERKTYWHKAIQMFEEAQLVDALLDRADLYINPPLPEAKKDLKTFEQQNVFCWQQDIFSAFSLCIQAFCQKKITKEYAIKKLNQWWEIIQKLDKVSQIDWKKILKLFNVDEFCVVQLKLSLLWKLQSEIKDIWVEVRIVMHYIMNHLRYDEEMQRAEILSKKMLRAVKSNIDLSILLADEILNYLQENSFQEFNSSTKLVSFAEKCNLHTNSITRQKYPHMLLWQQLLYRRDVLSDPKINDTERKKIIQNTNKEINKTLDEIPKDYQKNNFKDIDRDELAKLDTLDEEEELEQEHKTRPQPLTSGLWSIPLQDLRRSRNVSTPSSAAIPEESRDRNQFN